MSIINVNSAIAVTPSIAKAPATIPSPPAVSDPAVIAQKGLSAKRLAAVILLGGTVRTSQFGGAINRSLLDLPLSENTTLSTRWIKEITDLYSKLGLWGVPVRLVIGRTCFAPLAPATDQGVPIGVERDPVEFRGTGGVLRDLAQEYDDNQFLLVAHANQLLLRPLIWCVERLLETQGEVRVLAGPRQMPGGLFIFKCGCLRGISKSGYVDMKEQAIPSIAAKYRAQVVLADQIPSHSIRRWKDYLSCVRSQHSIGQAPEQENALHREDWQPLFCLTEKGANVAASASVHDSVVLAGGQVQDRAVVVRSLIGPGGVVRRGEVVVDRLVTANGNIE